MLAAPRKSGRAVYALKDRPSRESIARGRQYPPEMLPIVGLLKRAHFFWMGVADVNAGKDEACVDAVYPRDILSKGTGNEP